MGVVALIGVSKEQVFKLLHVQSVSAETKACGIRYAQKRKVSTSRTCADSWKLPLKSATLEMAVACAGPVTLSCRMSERDISPLKNSSSGAVMSLEL